MVKKSYHEEQHADYFNNGNFLHGSPIYFYFRLTKILEIYIFFKYIPRRDIFKKLTLSRLFWKKKVEGHRIGKR